MPQVLLTIRLLHVVEVHEPDVVLAVSETSSYSRNNGGVANNTSRRSATKRRTALPAPIECGIPRRQPMYQGRPFASLHPIGCHITGDISRSARPIRCSAVIHPMNPLRMPHPPRCPPRNFHLQSTLRFFKFFLGEERQTFLHHVTGGGVVNRTRPKRAPVRLDSGAVRTAAQPSATSGWLEMPIVWRSV